MLRVSMVCPPCRQCTCCLCLHGGQCRRTPASVLNGMSILING